MSSSMNRIDSSDEEGEPLIRKSYVSSSKNTNRPSKTRRPVAGSLSAQYNLFKPGEIKKNKQRFIHNEAPKDKDPLSRRELLEHSKSANIARQSSTQKAVPAYDSSKKPKAPEVVRLQAPKPLDKPRISLPASLNDMPEPSSNKRPLQSPLSSPERHSKKKKTETPDNAEYTQLEKKFNEQKEEFKAVYREKVDLKVTNDYLNDEITKKVGIISELQATQEKLKLDLELAQSGQSTSTTAAKYDDIYVQKIVEKFSEQAKKFFNGCKQHVEEHRTKAANLSADLATTKGELQMLKTQIKELSDENAAAKRELETIKKDNAENEKTRIKSNEVTAQNERITSLENTLKEKHEENEKLKSEIAKLRDDINQQFNETAQELLKLDQKNAQLKEDSEKAKKTNAEREQELEKLLIDSKKTVEDAQEIASKAQQRITELENERTADQAKIQESNKTIESMKSEMDTLRTNKSNAEKESLVQASVDKAEATKNINALKAEKERLEKVFDEERQRLSVIISDREENIDRFVKMLEDANEQASKWADSYYELYKKASAIANNSLGLGNLNPNVPVSDAPTTNSKD